MKTSMKDNGHLDATDSVLRTRLERRVRKLGETQAQIMLDFIEEVVEHHDPDVVHDFVRLRQDPRIQSVIQLAAGLSDEGCDQLLFAAEGIFADEAPRH